MCLEPNDPSKAVREARALCAERTLHHLVLSIEYDVQRYQRGKW